MSEEYISLDDLNNKRSTRVTTYEKPTVSERLKQAKGFIKQKVAERKITAPERMERRARIKTALENLGNKASGNISRRAKVKVRTNQGRFGNNLYNQSNSSSNMFNQPSSLGSNPFTIGGKNNSYNFSGRNSAPKKKTKPKGIFITFK